MTHPFSRLLLATEHSEHDAGSERVALAMAQRCGLPLAAVLPILSNPEYEAVAPELAARTEAAAAARVARLAAVAAEQGVTLEVKARRGPLLFREIVDEAAERAAELVIIRRRGKLGLLANLLVGEMVGQVLAHAPCSVLVTPRESTMWRRHVLIGLDPAAPDAAALEQGAAIAAQCDLPLTLLAVADSAGSAVADAALSAAQTRCRSVLAAGGASADALARVQVRRASGKPHKALIETAGQCGADLIVVGRHGDRSIQRAWVGGVTQKVIGLAGCPVLVAIGHHPSTEKPA